MFRVLEVYPTDFEICIRRESFGAIHSELLVELLKPTLELQGDNLG